MDGFEGNIYKSEDKLTRLQFANLLVETLELELVTCRGEFVDENNGHWVKDYTAITKTNREKHKFFIFKPIYR